MTEQPPERPAAQDRSLKSRYGRLSAVRRNMAGTVATTFLTQGTLLISSVASARILGVEDRGTLALMLYMAAVLPVVGTIGVPLAVTYELARSKSRGREVLTKIRPLVLGQIVVIQLLFGVILLAVFGGSDSEVKWAALVSWTGTPAMALFMYALAVLQGTERFRALNLCRLLYPPLSAAILVGLLVSDIGGLLTVTFVWVGLYWVTGLVTVVVAYRALDAEHEAEPKPAAAAVDDSDREEMLPPDPSPRQMSIFGAKSIFGAASPLDVLLLDQAIVGFFISQTALGTYVVAIAFTNVPLFIATSIGLVAYPRVAATSDPSKARRVTATFMLTTVVVCGTVIAAEQLALPWLVPTLFGEEFDAAVGVGRILLISTIFFCLRRVLTECARGLGRPGIGSVAEIVGLVILISLSIVLGDEGAKGVALALTIGAVASFLTLLVALRFPTRRHKPTAEEDLVEAEAIAESETTRPY